MLRNSSSHHRRAILTITQRRGLSATAAVTPRNFRRAENVGIVASDIYFPKRCVEQSALEKFDRIDAGRYTIGLGQTKMAFAGPEEDINSMCMTALHQLMQKYKIDPKDVGFLGVGTETLIDKSKSTKTHLMKYFAESGNTDIEGVTTINACYGGTASLLHAFDWMESSAWDGRYAIVLAGDIAVYAPGNARCTGGAGVVAMLVGPNAPIVMEQGTRSSHFEDVYDFYKPDMLSEYPKVDGALSNSCYIRSIDRCFQLYANKFEKKSPEEGPFTMSKHVQHAVFHLPYTKLVEKSFARITYNEMLRDTKNLDSFKEIRLVASSIPSLEATYTDRNLEKACMTYAKKEYERKVFPSTFSGRMIGNMYAGSLYGGLLALIAHHGDNLVGSRALMFSYGSGLAATMFSLKFVKSVSEQQEKCNLFKRLQDRTVSTPEEFSKTLNEREVFSTSKVLPSRTETELSSSLFPGTYYVSKVDELGRRFYSRSSELETVELDNSLIKQRIKV